MISPDERKILRDLAKQVAEIASLPVMAERRELWKKHNSLQPVRPMILIFPEGSWGELLPQSVLKCEDRQARGIEWSLRSRIYHHEHFQDDTVVEKEWIVSKAIRNSGWGLSAHLVMASTLIHIKSKMLLPGLNEGDDEEDPRDEITRPLLEYMRLKEMAEELSEREILGKDVFTRQESSWHQDEIDAEGPRLDVSLFQLIDAFRRIMEQNQPGADLTFKYQKWSVKEKSQVIIAFLKQKGEILFDEIFGEDRTVSEFIVTFLALLELVHIGLVRVFQPSYDSAIHVVAHFDENETTGDL